MRIGTRKSAMREAAFRGRRAVESREGDRHRGSGAGVTPAVTDPPSLASRHSYWTARTIESRLARRAG